jgi:capsular polysaccharide export protein
MSLRVLGIGYYDDFSRFFIAVKQGLIKIDEDIEFKYLTMYFSGFLYWILRDKNVLLISFLSKFKLLINYKKYKAIVATEQEYMGVKLDSVIVYHEKLEVDSHKLKLQVCSYIDTLNKIFDKFLPQVIICSSDSRIISELSTIIATQRKIKVLFFEQGPFGTTILDPRGVNANASIRGFKNNIGDYEVINKRVDLFMKRNRSAKYKRQPFYRVMDYIIEYLLNKTPLYPVDLLNSTNNTFFSSDKRPPVKYNMENNDGNKKIILILQVPFDVNMIYHSPHFSSHKDIVKSIVQNLPEGVILTVREHPLYKGKYEDELYSYCDKNKINIENDQPLSLAFEANDVVIVNNSTVGLESISVQKTTVVLGNAFYDSSGVCLKINNLTDLGTLLKESLNYKCNKSAIAGFNNELYFNYLIDGHFRDDDIDRLGVLIADKILRYVHA